MQIAKYRAGFEIFCYYTFVCNETRLSLSCDRRDQSESKKEKVEIRIFILVSYILT